MKVAINGCYGGFSLSNAAVMWIWERDPECAFLSRWPEDDDKSVLKGCIGGPWIDKGNGWEQHGDDENLFTELRKDGYLYASHIINYEPEHRANPLLIECIETLGEKANGPCADIRIINIPDDVKFVIEEYDGLEHIAEEHRVWS